METKEKVNDFTHLLAWQESHKLVILVYKYSSTFPKNEIFGLTSQIRRASVSVVSNIAEGFGRIYPKEKVQFYTRSHGSLTEVKSQLYIARDLNYLAPEMVEKLIDQLDLAHKLLSGLLRSSRSRI